LREYRDRHYERAAAICRTELERDSRNLEAHVVLCWSLIALGRYDEALEYARAGREMSRYDSRIAEILGEVAYYQGRNREALRYFQEYIGLAPEGARAAGTYYFLGEIFIRLGRFRHADIALTTAVHYVPGNSLWWTRLAYARENAGDLPQAAVSYEQAIALNPQNTDARRGFERVRRQL